MLTRLVCLGWVVLVCASTGYSQQDAIEKPTGGSISGSIPALDLKAHQRAVITWTRQVTDEPTKAPISGAVLTDEKGQFTIDAVWRQLFRPVSDNYFSLSATTTSFV
ncbi:hypothetical protein [uncultured Paludibaculum sp.]|uniref:hypothetical protein n=1 Tax=uncultured Paludibaculum sp. TaxID=1765020 RepID=UPI002AAA7433|nr:hypothetical protein [uncultured Paludibaculum sp.]